MTLSEYQKLAKRTCDKTLCVKELELHALHGLSGECGEIHSIYQKVYQGHKFDKDHLKSELGDLLWFIGELATANDLSLEDIASHNIEKLKARYPEGFDVEHSLHRAQGDI